MNVKKLCFFLRFCFPQSLWKALINPDLAVRLSFFDSEKVAIIKVRVCDHTFLSTGDNDEYGGGGKGEYGGVGGGPPGGGFGNTTNGGNDSEEYGGGGPPGEQEEASEYGNSQQQSQFGR